jgi:hypothetical protein
MIKKIVPLIIILIVSINAFSQNVGINGTGASPAASAGLDVDFTDKGLLIPRVALTALNAAGPVTSPATSLIVYNTATAGTTPNNVFPGYYYWDGAAWIRLRTEQNIKFITSNVVNSNATANTMADVTGLSFAVTSGVTYKFRFFIVYTSAATTTGSRWSINGPTVTTLHYQSEYALTTTSKTFNNGLTAYNSPKTSSASSAATGSNIAVIEGIITPSASGTVIARFASEIANSAITALANLSYVQWEILR